MMQKVQTEKSVKSINPNKSVIQTTKSTFQKYPAYKDSGVEWMGEIPEGWQVKRLASFGEFSKGGGFSKNELKSEGLKAVLYGDIYTKYKYVIRNAVRHISIETATKSIEIEKGDILFTGSGETREDIGKCVLFDGDQKTFAGGDIIIFKQKKNSPHFLKYILNSNGVIAEKAKTAKGEIIVHTYGSKLKNIYLPLPPLPEQTAIANFLDDKTAKIDQAIAQKEKLIALLKERKQILIQQAVTKGLDPKVKMKDSGIKSVGYIPNHWKIMRLKYILDSQGRIGFKGYTTSDLVDKGEGALTLGASHMDWDGNLKLDAPVFISWKKYYESPEIMVSQGDILIVQRGSTCGKVALVNVDLGPTTINPSLVLLKNLREYPNFVFEGIKVVLEEILNIVSNTAIPMLSQFQIDNILIPIPPIEEQFDIVQHIKTQSAKIDQALTLQQTQIEKLKEYKATLIDSVVTGKIKVV